MLSERSNKMTAHASQDFPDNMPMGVPILPQLSTRAATPIFDLPKNETSFSDCGEGDEYTLSAFGDISLSNIYFVPSLPSNVSPRRDDTWIGAKIKRTPPPMVAKASTNLAEHPLPSVIKNILPPSPSAAAISPGTEFDRLVERLRECRDTDNKSPSLRAGSPTQPRAIHSPQPRHAINFKAISNLNAKIDKGPAPSPTVQDSAIQAAPAQAVLHTKRITAPKPKERPLRGYAKLPPRPPLPRWDLHELAVHDTKLEDARCASYGNVPGKMSKRT